MPSDKRKRPKLNTSYGNSVLKEEQNARFDFFNDDDIDDELSDEKDYDSVYRSEERVKAKAHNIKKTLDKRRNFDNSDTTKEQGDIQLKTKTGRRKSSFVLGMIIIIFAVIGFVNVSLWIGNGIITLIHNDSKLKRYDDIIAPVVYFDPEPFESWQGADGHMLMYISVWDTISNSIVSNSAGNNYEMNDSGRTVIPSEDISKNAQRIFGSDIVLDYEFFDDTENEIYYNKETDCVEVFNTGIDGFSHKVLSIDRNKDSISAVVGYIEPDLYGDSSSNDNEINFSKKMIYILSKDKKTDKYYVSALREYAEKK